MRSDPGKAAIVRSGTLALVYLLLAGVDWAQDGPQDGAVGASAQAAAPS